MRERETERVQGDVFYAINYRTLVFISSVPRYLFIFYSYLVKLYLSQY